MTVSVVPLVFSVPPPTVSVESVLLPDPEPLAMTALVPCAPTVSAPPVREAVSVNAPLSRIRPVLASPPEKASVPPAPI
ncbi:MAG: hypothetical protein WDN04_01635 [Rhodospirillales bacterium]